MSTNPPLQRSNLLFGIDIRSLLLFRVALGILVIWEVLKRWPLVDLFYTEHGVVPRWLQLLHLEGPYTFSLHMAHGGSVFVHLLMLAMLLSGVALVLGFRTRLATGLSWLLLLSLLARNTLVVTGADSLLLLLLFWACFLPLGAHFSLDARDRSIGFSSVPMPGSLQVRSPATVAVQVQMLLMYVFTAILKNDPAWHADGTAIYYALQFDAIVRPLGQVVLDYPTLMKFGTFAVLALEFAAPLMLFSFWKARIRTFMVFALMAMHIGILLTMDVGLFSYCSMAGLMVFLPTTFWDKIWPLPSSSESLQEDSMPSFPSQGGVGYNIQKAVVLVALVIVVWWNVGMLFPKTKMPDLLYRGAQSLGLSQSWHMFAPKPPVYDGWFWAPGKTKDKQQVELFKWLNHGIIETTAKSDKPARVADTFGDHLMMVYFIGLSERKRYDSDGTLTKPLLKALGTYVCERWNSTQPSSKWLLEFSLYFFGEQTMPPGKEPLRKKHLLWKQKCKLPKPKGCCSGAVGVVHVPQVEVSKEKKQKNPVQRATSTSRPAPKASVQGQP